MGEKSILAYFHSPEQAEGVKRKLEALRAVETSIDRISRFPDAFSNSSAAIMAAADVTMSGMSDGGQLPIDGRDILLTVVIDERNYDKALEVIRQAGGLV
jgi:hypothetical protein